MPLDVYNLLLKGDKNLGMSGHHIPTGVHISQLDYHKVGGKKVEVLLVGNPLTAGPIVNDGSFLKTKGLKDALHVSLAMLTLAPGQVVSKEPCKSGSELVGVSIPADFIRIAIPKEKFKGTISNRTEIFVKYETTKGEFWKKHETFCDYCLLTDSTADNLIVECDNSECPAGRHVQCWGNDRGPKTRAAIEQDSLKHYCQMHLPKSQVRSMPRQAVKDTRQAAAAALSGIISNNFPPSKLPTDALILKNPRDRSQLYIVDDSSHATGLAYNCKSLGVKVEPSGIGEAAGFGLFNSSKKTFEPNHVVGWFWGKIISKDRHSSLINDDAEAEGLEEVSFLEEHGLGVSRSLDLSQSCSDVRNEYIMLVSKQCPVGYINDPRPAKKNQRKPTNEANCALEWPSSLQMSSAASSSVHWQAFPIRTTAEVPPNKELFWKYNFDPRTKQSRSARPKLVKFTPRKKDWLEEIMDVLGRGTPPETVKERQARVLKELIEEHENYFACRLDDSTKPTVSLRPTPYVPNSPLPRHPADLEEQKAAVGPAAAVAPAEIEEFKLKPDPAVSTANSKVEIEQQAATITDDVEGGNRKAEVEPETKAEDAGESAKAEGEPVAPAELEADVVEKEDANMETHSVAPSPEFKPQTILSSPVAPSSPPLDATQPLTPISMLQDCDQDQVFGPESDESDEEPDDHEANTPILDLSVDSEINDQVKMMQRIGSCQLGSDECVAVVEQMVEDESPSDDDESSQSGEEDEVEEETDDSDDDPVDDDFQDHLPNRKKSPVRSSSTAHRVKAQNPTQLSKKYKVRTQKQTEKLLHWKPVTLSQFDIDRIKKRAEEHVKVMKSKRLSSDDILYTSRGACNLEKLPKDFAEVQACCADPDRLPSLPENHPFKTLMNFVEYRCLTAAGKGGGEHNQSMLHVLSNRSLDPDDTDRKVPLHRVLICGGTRICESCFRASMGISRQTMYRLKAFLDSGQIQSVDLRKHRVCLDRTISNQLVGILRTLADNGLADTVPNPANGNPKWIYLEASFTQRVTMCEWVQTQLNKGKLPDAELQKVSPNTLDRALTRLKTEHNIFLSYAKTKRFMKCTSCRTMDNARRAAKTALQKVTIANQRLVHFMQVAEQRAYYHLVRDIAKQPDGGMRVFVLLTDGMDQAKTELPAEMRPSKDTEGIPGLGVHVVSTFVFGGLQPILGQLNLPDVKKDSGLTVTNIHNAITRQFDALLAKHEGKLTSWPERLHVVFDNAEGENLNSMVFSYLALLVHAGIFLKVTVGTLLVGHTHNINDQLFSVWSRYLNSHDCMTLSEMMTAFSERYNGHVKETSAQTSARLEHEKMDEDQSQRGTEFSSSSHESYSTELMHISKHLPKKLRDQFRQDELQVIQDIDDAAAVSKPIVELVERSVNISGWIADDLKKRTHKEVFKGIGRYHVFAFSKNEQGVTGMYHRFVHQAENHYPEKHEHLLDGIRYRAYRPLFQPDHVVEDDPLAMPLQPFDTSSIRKLIATLIKEKGLTPDQHNEWSETCKRLEDQITQQNTACSDCARITASIEVVGTLHRPTGSERNSIALMQTYRDGSKKRDLHRKELLQHLKEADPRSHMVMKGWWTKWIRVRIPMIQEHYRSRGLLTVPEAANFHLTGRLAHPLDATDEEMKAKGRVDDECMASRGAPRKGQFVATRAERTPGQIPFWLGSVLAYFTPSAEDIAYYTALTLAHAYRSNNPNKLSSPQARLPSKPASVLEREARLYELSAEQKDQDKEDSKTRSKKAGKDKLQSAAKESIFEHTHMLVDWWSHVERPILKAKAKRKALASGEASDPSSKRQKMDSNTQVPDHSDNELSDIGEEERKEEIEASKKRKALTSNDGSELGTRPNKTAKLMAEEQKDSINNSIEHPSRSLSGPIPASDLDQFKSCVWEALKQPYDLTCLIPSNTAIWWNDQSKILTSGRKLTAEAWTKIVTDLGQEREV